MKILVCLVYILSFSTIQDSFAQNLSTKSLQEQIEPHLKDYFQDLVESSAQMDGQLRLLAYTRLSDEDAKKRISSLIELTTAEENFHILQYDREDISMANLEVFSFKELKENLKISSNNHSLKQAEKSLVHLKEYLEQELACIDSLPKSGDFSPQTEEEPFKEILCTLNIYRLTWKYNNKEFSTICFFKNIDLVYDSVLSKLATYEVQGERREEGKNILEEVRLADGYTGYSKVALKFYQFKVNIGTQQAISQITMEEDKSTSTGGVSGFSGVGLKGGSRTYTSTNYLMKTKSSGYIIWMGTGKASATITKIGKDYIVQEEKGNPWDFLKVVEGNLLAKNL